MSNVSEMVSWNFDGVVCDKKFDQMSDVSEVASWNNENESTIAEQNVDQMSNVSEMVSWNFDGTVSVDISDLMLEFETIPEVISAKFSFFMNP
jgi:hypothetical protein